MHKLQDICRVCKISESPLNNIFELRAAKSASEMLSECLQMPVSIDDNLPKKICLQCHAQLEVAYDFLNKARRSINEFSVVFAIANSSSHEIQIKDLNAANLEHIADIEYLDETSQPFVEQNEASPISSRNLQLLEDEETPIKDIYQHTTQICNICQKTFLTVKALNFHQRIWHKNIQCI